MRDVLVWLWFGVALGPASAQTTLNMSEDLVRLGIASTNMTPNQPNADAGPLLFKAVQYAETNQIGRVIADTGNYYFLSQQDAHNHVALAQLKNITIDFQSSELYFADPLKNGLGVYGGDNVTLQNLTVDYSRLLYTQLRVTFVDAAKMQLQFTVEPGWRPPKKEPQ